MTDSSNSAAVSIAEALFVTIAFVLVALTGNCHCNGCGLSTDYVEMWSTP